jgi:hypothetical protein
MVRPRNYWDIGHGGTQYPTKTPSWRVPNAGASASISTQPTTALAFGCVRNDECEALSVPQLPCA